MFESPSSVTGPRFDSDVNVFLRTIPALVAWLAATLPSATALAADQFEYTMRREIRAMDVKTGAEVPIASEKLGSEVRRTLGVTGRIAIARRMTMVDDGGQIFVYASVPEALAAERRDLDVLIDGKDGMRVRGTIHYEPGASRRVSRLFVIPELTPGPTLVEIHARGVHVSDWQEIVTEEIDVPKEGRLRFGYMLEGGQPKSSGVELVVEARPAKGAEPFAPVKLFSTRMSPSDRDWEEETKDLAKLAGRRVQLAFRSRPSSGGTASSPGVVWGAPAIEQEQKRQAFPIILVVSLDSLRASEVGVYSDSDSTPFLDGFFGRKGAVMTRAITQSVTTLPSHLTLMTGLNPMSHGVVDEKKSLGPGVTTLAQALRDKGWHTAAFTEGGALAGEIGFRRGFDIYDEGDSSEIDPDRSDAIDRARRWLEEYSGAPLFLFVHTYATRPVHGGGVVNAEIRKKKLVAYGKQVRRADSALEKLFDSLDGRIDEDQALYVVLSGHGEEFFEHDSAGHGTQLYEETVRVPLLVRGSSVDETGRLDLVVGLVDVAPTVLELSGVRMPASMQGRSFARLLANGQSVLPASRFSEARRPVRLTGGGQLLRWGAPSYTMREGTKKLIWNSGAGDTFEAYDLATDPNEQRNLVRVEFSPDWAVKMSATLRNYPAAAGRTAKPGGKAELSPANRSRLESLGYAR